MWHTHVAAARNDKYGREPTGANRGDPKGEKAKTHIVSKQLYAKSAQTFQISLLASGSVPCFDSWRMIVRLRQATKLKSTSVPLTKCGNPVRTSCHPSRVVTVKRVSRDHKRLSKFTMPE